MPDSSDTKAKARRFVDDALLDLKSADLDSALGKLDLAVDADPTNAEAYRNRALTRARKRDFDGAIADFDKAAWLKPKDAEIYYFRGLAWQHKGDLKRAIEDYDRALEVSPNHAKARENRILLGDQMGISRPPEPIDPKQVSADDWFYSVGRDKRGPVKSVQLVELASAGTIDGRTYVWRRGMVGWERAENMEFWNGMEIPPPLPHDAAPIIKTPPTDYASRPEPKKGPSFRARIMARLWPDVTTHAGAVTATKGGVSVAVYGVFSEFVGILLVLSAQRDAYGPVSPDDQLVEIIGNLIGIGIYCIVGFRLWKNPSRIIAAWTILVLIGLASVTGLFVGNFHINLFTVIAIFIAIGGVRGARAVRLQINATKKEPALARPSPYDDVVIVKTQPNREINSATKSHPFN